MDFLNEYIYIYKHRFCFHSPTSLIQNNKVGADSWQYSHSCTALCIASIVVIFECDSNSHFQSPVSITWEDFNIKNSMLLSVMACCVVCVPTFQRNMLPPFYTNEGGSRFLWNISILPLHYRASHSRRLNLHCHCPENPKPCKIIFICVIWGVHAVVDEDQSSGVWDRNDWLASIFRVVKTRRQQDPPKHR